MRRGTAILGSGLFIVIVPCTVAGLIPWWMTDWQLQPAFLGWEPGRIIGVIFLLAGILGLLEAFARFAIQGLGTPAPVAPPRNLVITGLYRYVRNPMYVSVIAIIVGQALLLGDWRLIAYAALFWFVTHLFVVFHEEPTLSRNFGEPYADYCAKVPRWIARLTPWRDG
jgi:protein-S-isoprenylcysteine O-methyltransferase Ste14